MSATARIEQPAALDVRADFPALTQRIHGQPLTYLDTAASALKPQCVIDRMSDFYARDYANIHRGVHTLSVRATDAYEAARDRVARFINAPTARSVIFTRNATEAINLIAASFGRTRLQAGDEILITALEHHANIVPWQMLAQEKGIVLKVAPITPEGVVTTESIDASMTARTRIIAVAHISNALGTILPVANIIALAQQKNIPVLLDGCQAVSHQKIDVQALGCDFYVFSGHKLYGPSGIGVLWGKEDMLNSLPPYQGGGDMIETVAFTGTTYKNVPERFEAGTPAIAEAVGLAAAIDYVESIGLDTIAAHEYALVQSATRQLKHVKGLRLIGTAPEKAAIVSFLLDGIHAHDVGTVLDRCGVAVRVGNHCAQPLMELLGVPSTVRASFGIYNHEDDLNRLIAGLHKVQEMFA